MKIIHENSILRNLPHEIESRTRLVFDSIGITSNLIEISYKRLRDQLENESNDEENANSRLSAFLDCWSIIDNTRRLLKLCKQIPSESNHDFLKPIEIVNDFRNTFQHIDERVDEIFHLSKRPHFGSINWVYKNEKNKRSENMIMVSGILLDLNEEFVIPKYSNDQPTISKIILNSMNKKEVISIEIDSLINSLTKVISTIETHLKKEMSLKELIPLNWKKRRDVVLKMINEK